MISGKSYNAAAYHQSLLSDEELLIRVVETALEYPGKQLLVKYLVSFKQQSGGEYKEKTISIKRTIPKTQSFFFLIHLFIASLTEDTPEQLAL